VMKILQLNLCLLSSNKADVVRRSVVISTVPLIVDPSRLSALFQNDWDFDMVHFKEAAFEHWSLPTGERTIVDWSGIEKLKLVAGTQAIKSIEELTSLFKFRWTGMDPGGLCLSMFENVKGESRASKETVCDRNNSGVAVVIRRLNNIMISLMSISY
jgi:hypothetical protein